MLTKSLIIDWLLIIIFTLMLISKIINLPFDKIIQPVFLILIIIHIGQHWRVILHSIKNLFN